MTHDEPTLFDLPTVFDVTMQPGAAELRDPDGTVVARLEFTPGPRETFLTGLLATWVAHDREAGSKPTKDDRARAAVVAQDALVCLFSAPTATR